MLAATVIASLGTEEIFSVGFDTSGTKTIKHPKLPEPPVILKKSAYLCQTARLSSLEKHEDALCLAQSVLNGRGMDPTAPPGGTSAPVWKGARPSTSQVSNIWRRSL